MNIGAIVNFTCNIDDPIKMNLQMSPNSLDIVVGMNGTGKTLSLVNIWAIGLLAWTLNIENAFDRKGDGEKAQFIWDNSLKDQNLNGILACDFESGANIQVQFEKGKVISVAHSGVLGCEVSRPVFLSKNMRTFEDKNLYLKMRKAMNLPKAITSMADYMKILSAFKLYDVIYMEALIYNQITPGTIAKLNDRLDPFKGADMGNPDIPEFASITVDLDAADIYYTDTAGKKASLSSLGAGTQSLVTMFLGVGG